MITHFFVSKTLQELLPTMILGGAAFLSELCTNFIKKRYNLLRCVRLRSWSHKRWKKIMLVFVLILIAVFVAAGGVCEAEGCCLLAISGTKEQEDATERLIESIAS